MTHSPHRPTTPAAAARTVSSQRVTAWGQEMRTVHQRLRDALDICRETIENGGRPESPTTDLQLYCGGFCRALSGHHSSEDAQLFPLVLRNKPELAATVATLTRDHNMIAHLIRALEAAVRGDDDAAVLLRHLDGIEAVRETHFRFEELKLVGLLDTIDAGELSRSELFGPL